MAVPEEVQQYQPMTLVDLAGWLRDADESTRWRLIAEFLEEYRWEPSAVRQRLLEDEPPTTGDNRWDVFLGALAEHLAAREDHGAPDWADDRRLTRFWFPVNTRAGRADALVHAPAAFRGRGVFVAARDLEVA